jgi:DNA-binding response OmpR family regulator
MNVLLVEDDDRIIEFVLRGLHAEGYHVDVARNGPDALRRALAPACQLIILDLLLPTLMVGRSAGSCAPPTWRRRSSC